MYGCTPMEFFIYSITYLDDEFETKREDGIMAANSYADAMEEVGLWDLSVEEVRLRKVCGEYQEMNCERPWLSIENLKEALEEAGLQLSTKPTPKCSCREGSGESAPSCKGGACDEK